MSDNSTSTDVQQDSLLQEGEDSKAEDVESAPKSAPSFLNKDKGEEENIPLWLVTFGDTMALMLTFFVLLFAMSSPKEESWEAFTMSLNRQLGHDFKKEDFSGAVDAIEIEKFDKGRALSLNYLNNLLENKQAEDERLKGMTLNLQKGRLIVSLPADLLFESGSIAITENGKRVIYVLADVLSRIRNKIDIVGHTDPTPVYGEFESNWHLSLERAASVANILQTVGYSRDVTIRGLSDALYQELPDTLSQEEKLKLSRRVDIVIQKDDGRRKATFKLDGL